MGLPDQTAYLVMDNCTAHFSEDVRGVLDRHNVTAVFIPPNSSHVFQPLDRCLFASFKAHLNSAIPMEVDKQTARLLKILQSWDDARKVSTIKASFNLAGFVHSVENRSLRVSFVHARADVPGGIRVPPPPEPRSHRISITN